MTTDGKLYGYLEDNADSMRHIILALVALVAISGLLPAIMASNVEPLLLGNTSTKTQNTAETSLLTTASQAAFLNDSWTPSSFKAPIADQATGVLKNMTNNNTTLANSTYAIYDFLDDNYTAPAAGSPVYDTPIKIGQESIYDFLSDTWTPSTAVEPYEQSPFKQRQMN